jgi:hypothetical protein
VSPPFEVSVIVPLEYVPSGQQNPWQFGNGAWFSDGHRILLLVEGHTLWFCR